MHLLSADCLEALKGLAENSVDSVVTDPPYGWRFMGKAWDGADIEKHFDADPEKYKVFSDGRSRKRGDRPANAAGSYDQSNKGNQAFQAFSESWAREAYRVLKPGGHMLVFCGPRTYHRMASGLEDAGFEIRDQLQWLFGQGFPKSLNISKAIDKAAGAEPTVVGQNPNWRPAKTHGGAGFDAAVGEGPAVMKLTTPTTPIAKQWDGWGSALKPANEPICLARKPLEKGLTIAENVQKWGTGGINIDGCRIESGERPLIEMNRRKMEGSNTFRGSADGSTTGSKCTGVTAQGRFPANVLLDEVAGEMLNEQVKGKLHKAGNKNPTKMNTSIWDSGGSLERNANALNFKDFDGGASRFFYCAKASTSERNRGVDKNSHPTVKPVRLMEYLVKLITPPNGIVLDPFMGSGTTGIACKNLGAQFLGIELERQYFEIAAARIIGHYR